MTPKHYPSPFFNWKAVHRAIDALNDLPDANITSAAVATVVAIARRIQPETGIAMATYDNIVGEGRVSSRNLPRVLDQLIELGILERTSGGQPNRANRYRLGAKVPELMEAEKSTGTKKSGPGTTGTPMPPSRINKLLNYA